MDYIINNGNVLTYQMFFIGAGLLVITGEYCLGGIESIHDAAQWLRKRLFFNPLIVLIKESMLMTAICLFIGFNIWSFENSQQTFQSLIVVSTLAFILLAPVALTMFTLRHYH